jgi:hypothetical protein
MKLLSLSLAAIVFAVFVAGTPAVSVTPSTATCNARWTLKFSPPIAPDPGVSAWTSHGETGTIQCAGTVNGHIVTGAGTTGSHGVFEGSCVMGGTASETISITVPTTGGPQKLAFKTTLVVGPGTGIKFSDSFVGLFLFEYYPTKGDCLNTPVEEIVSFGQGVLKS